MKLGTYIDFGFHLEREEEVERVIRRLGAAGYDYCILCLDSGAYDFPYAPGLARAHSFNQESLRRFGAAARAVGIELIPHINSLAHTEALTSRPGYEQYDEGYEIGRCYGSLRVRDEKTYELIERFYRGWCEAVPDGKYICAALDEAPYIGQWLLNTGREKEIDCGELFAEHANRVNRIVKSFGRRMMIYGDMFWHRDDALRKLDKDIIVADWYYLPFGHHPVHGPRDIRLTEHIAEAGLTAWAVAATWPNDPWPNFQDRLENVRAWSRYLNSVNPEGTLIIGNFVANVSFLNVAELLWLTFARMAPDFILEEFLPALRETLAVDFGVAADDALLLALLELGNHQSDGAAADYCLQSAPQLLTGDPEQAANLAKHAGRLREIAAVTGAAKSGRPEGRELLRGAQLAAQFMAEFYETRVVLSRLWSSGTRGAAPELRTRAAALAAYQRDYDEYYSHTRYPGDVAVEGPVWAGHRAKELVAEAERLEKNPGSQLFDDLVLIEFEIISTRLVTPRVDFISASGTRTVPLPMRTAFRMCETLNYGFTCRRVVAVGTVPEKIRVNFNLDGTLTVIGITMYVGSRKIAWLPTGCGGQYACIADGRAVLGSPDSFAGTSSFLRPGEWVEFVPEKE